MALQVNVTKDKVTITNLNNVIVNKGEYNINNCSFSFSQEYNLTPYKRAIFSNLQGELYVQEINNNSCIIPEEILENKGEVALGVYAYENDGDTLLLRYSPSPASFEITSGSYVENAKTCIPPSDMEDIYKIMEEYANTNLVKKSGDLITGSLKFGNDANHPRLEINSNNGNIYFEPNSANNLSVLNKRDGSLELNGSNASLYIQGGVAGVSIQGGLANLGVSGGDGSIYTNGTRAGVYIGRVRPTSTSEVDSVPSRNSILVQSSGEAINHASSALGSSFALNTFAHSEGSSTIASGYCSHAEGSYSGYEPDVKATGTITEIDTNKKTITINLTDGTLKNGYILFGRNANAKHTILYSSNNTKIWLDNILNLSVGETFNVFSPKGVASGDFSHSEGLGCISSAVTSHSEGQHTKSSGTASHSEGINTSALHDIAHVEGYNTISGISNQHVEGRFNLIDNTSIHVVGNGANENARSNAHTLDLNGNAWFAGDVYIGSASGTHKDEGSKKLATEDMTKVNYSTTEQVIGTWIDGKPLYEKVGKIRFTAITDGPYTIGDFLSSNIEYCAIEKIFVTDCGCVFGLYNGNHSTIDNQIYIEAKQSSAQYGYIIGFVNRTDLLNKDFYVVARYTKTTDTAQT